MKARINEVVVPAIVSAIASSTLTWIVMTRQALPAAIAPTSAPALFASASEKIPKIFKFEILGARIEYLETITGPAMRTWQGVNEYRVDGCDVRVGQVLGEIQFMKLEVNSKCTFDLKNMMPDNGYKGLVHALTMGDFDRQASQSAELMMKCLDCGRDMSIPRGIYEYGAGSMVDEQTDILVEAPEGAKEAPAVQRWVADLRKTHGKAWVDNSGYACDQDVSNTLKPAVSNIRISAITIGHDVPTPRDSCPSSLRGR